MKRTSKILVVLLLFLILIQNSVSLANVVKIGETKYIERGEQGFYTIQYWNSEYNKWYYITYSRTYYTDDSGQKRIAYCCMPDANGVGWIPGEYEGYDTTIQYKLSNNDEQQKKLWRVFKNGYPYVSPEKLGVETEDDAYIATKQAAYFIIRGRSENEVYGHFRAGEDPINGQDLNETKRRGAKVVDAIYNLVKIGNTSSETMTGVQVLKKGEINKDEESSYQEYKVSNNGADEKLEITNLSNAPKGTRIVDKQGNDRTVFKAGESFRIIFDNKSIDKDYEIIINYKTTCKNYPVFYAKSKIEGTQDYLLSVEKYDDEYGELKLKVDSNKCKFELLKLDEKSKKIIPGVTFNIKYKNGNNIGEYITDENGKIELKNLKPGKIIVTEVDTPKEYIVNPTPKEYELIYNQAISVEIDNKEAVPKIEIKKEGVDSTYANEEIRYNFKISNVGNVALEDFTWYDFLPYDKARITKIATGTFNQEQEYNIYYRTDKNNNYVLLKEKLSTKSNNFIDLSDINLEDNEEIIEIKYEFGDVDINFHSDENPYFYFKVKENLKEGEIIKNKTKLEAKYRGTSIVSNDDTETVVNKKTEEIKKLPRTGF